MIRLSANLWPEIEASPLNVRLPARELPEQSRTGSQETLGSLQNHERSISSFCQYLG